MILEGNQRAGDRELALHLLKDENDHVEVYELRGFVSDDLESALKEIRAVSKGTRAKQYLYSLSLNPPPNAKVSTETFLHTIERVEKTLNLNNQPRGIVFHEKEGRRHCHVVWSRIDAQEMKAIPLPHTKRKLMEISKSLYIEHGWQMPKGMLNSQERDPNNFTHAQWQQSKRIGKDPKEIKKAFQDCWSISNNQDEFAKALETRGYRLAKGDRRGFVALDHRCEVFAVSKWTGLKTKAVREKLKQEDRLPSVSDTRVKIATDMTRSLTAMQAQQEKAIRERQRVIEEKRKALVEKQRLERAAQKRTHEQRKILETLARQARYRKGLSGLLDRVSGKHKKIRVQNEKETLQHRQRDRREKDHLIFQHLEHRQSLTKRHERLEQFKENRKQALSQDVQQFREITQKKRDVFEFQKAMSSRRKTIKREL